MCFLTFELFSYLNEHTGQLMCVSVNVLGGLFSIKLNLKIPRRGRERESTFSNGV